MKPVASCLTGREQRLDLEGKPASPILVPAAKVITGWTVTMDKPAGVDIDRLKLGDGVTGCGRPAPVTLRWA